MQSFRRVPLTAFALDHFKAGFGTAESRALPGRGASRMSGKLRLFYGRFSRTGVSAPHGTAAELGLGWTGEGTRPYVVRADSFALPCSEF